MNYRSNNCLSENDVLFYCQFGFRKKHSTTHALIDLQDKITLAIENNIVFIENMFMDLSKSFQYC